MMTPLNPFHELDSHGLRPPRILTIAITGACNLTCSHCWVSAGETTSPSHVPLQTLRRLINDFSAIGGTGIRITGGEPLCHPHWLDILHLSRSLGFTTVILQTNAMLIRDEHIAFLQNVDFPGLVIQISLDGATPQSHDLVRGDGTFTAVQAAMLQLVQAGLGQRLSIFFTEMRHNIAELPVLLDFAISHGIGAVTSGAMVQCGRGAETSQLAPPEAEQYLKLLDRYDHDPVFREQYGKIGTIAAVEWRMNRTPRQECCTFVENPYITPTGRMYPCLLCHTDEFSVSGVFEKGLANALTEGAPLWATLQRISASRVQALPHCQDCPAHASCAGGCTGRAWGSSRNLLAADDRCSARRAIYSHGCSKHL